jgi:hypothetical protein
MSEDVPRFDGAEVVRATQLRLTGRVDFGPAQLEALDLDAEVVYLVVGSVSFVGHERILGRVVRSHTVKMTAAYPLEAGEAQVLLAEARRRQSVALDAILGRERLPFPDDDDADPGDTAR